MNKRGRMTRNPQNRLLDDGKSRKRVGNDFPLIISMKVNFLIRLVHVCYFTILTTDYCNALSLMSQILGCQVEVITQACFKGDHLTSDLLQIFLEPRLL